MTDDMRPLCFVLMPFDVKSDDGVSIDFDALYAEVFRPAVEAAGLRPLRADEEQVAGIIQKPMFERLVLCEYALADLTWANANVYYELGVRHAVRPYSTVLTFARGSRLPFDLGPLRGLHYAVDPSGRPCRIEQDRRALADGLRAARRKATDSPVFQLVDALPVPDVSRLKTDVFRERAQYSTLVRERLAAARSADVRAVRTVERTLGDLRDVESGVLVDLLLSYRAVGAHRDMIRLVDAVPEPVARATLVREQYAFALNRVGQGDRAERILLALIEERGPSSETYGLLGRVYKDRWEAARTCGETLLARGLLDQAIAAYLAGFHSDLRDHYPGVNAVHLMTLREPPDPRAAEIIPVIRYSLTLRIASGHADYWDWATLVELAAIEGDRSVAEDALAHALACVREPWEPASTRATIRRLREARSEQGEPAEWLVEVERALTGPQETSADAHRPSPGRAR